MKKKPAPPPTPAVRIGRPASPRTSLSKAMIELGWTNRALAALLDTQAQEVNLWRQGKPISKHVYRILSVTVPDLPAPEIAMSRGRRRWKVHDEPLVYKLPKPGIDPKTASDAELREVAAR